MKNYKKSATVFLFSIFDNIKTKKMRAILYSLCLTLVFACSSPKISPLDGAWVWIGSSGEILHVYTFDDGWTGFGLDLSPNSGSKMTFGEIQFKSDSTAIMVFYDNQPVSLDFKLIENNGCLVTFGTEYGTWTRVVEPQEYEENNKEKAIRAGIYAKRKK